MKRRDRLTDLVYDIEIKNQFGIMPMLILDCVRSTVERRLVDPDPRYCKTHQGALYVNIPKRFIAKYMAVDGSSVTRHLKTLVKNDILLQEDLTDLRADGYWYAFTTRFIKENPDYFLRTVPPVPDRPMGGISVNKTGGADCTTPPVQVAPPLGADCTASGGADCTTSLYTSTEGLNNTTTTGKSDFSENENPEAGSIEAWRQGSRDPFKHPATLVLFEAFPYLKEHLTAYHCEQLILKVGAAGDEGIAFWRDETMAWATLQAGLDPKNLKRLITNWSTGYYGSTGIQDTEPGAAAAGSRAGGKADSVPAHAAAGNGRSDVQPYQGSQNPRALPKRTQRGYSPGRPSGQSLEEFLQR